jgi:hypothetical protein
LTETIGLTEFFRETIREVRNISRFFSASVAEASRASYNSFVSVSSYANWLGLLEPEKTIMVF